MYHQLSDYPDCATRMYPNITYTSSGVSAPTHKAPLAQPIVSVSQRGVDHDAYPTIARHDLSNMALLFAMGGSYPGCWRTSDQDLKRNDVKEEIADEVERDEPVMDSVYTSKEREEHVEEEEQPTAGCRLCLALSTSAGEERNEAEIDISTVPSLYTGPSSPIWPLTGVPQSKEEKRDAGPDTTAMKSSLGLNKRRARRESRKGASLSPRYVPTGAPSALHISPMQNRDTWDGVKRSEEELYDEKGFLIEDDVRREHDALDVYGEARRDSEERYPKYVTGMATVPITPMVYREWRRQAEAQQDLSVPEERSSMSFFQKREEKARRHSLNPQELHRAPATGWRIASAPEDEPRTSGRSSSALNELRIPKRRKPRPEGFVPFRQLWRDSGRILRNGDNIQRQGEGRQVLFEADPRADEIGVQRNASSFSWRSGIVDEAEVGSRDALIAGKGRRYKLVRNRGVLGSQGNAPGCVMAGMSDQEIAATSREWIDPSCLLHRTQPLRRTRTESFEPDLHPRLNDKEKQTHVQSIQDTRSYVEDAYVDDRVYIEPQEGIHQELPGELAQRASQQGLVPRNSYEHVQYRADLYDETAYQQGIHGRLMQRHAVSSEFSSSSSSQRPTHHCSTGRIAHTQVSVVDQFYPPMRVGESASLNAAANEDEKLLTTEDSFTDHEIDIGTKSRWCWPFGRTRRASGSQSEPRDEQRDAKKKNSWIRKPKAERRKLSKLLPPDAPTREWKH